ncbi:hypothetical protein LP422_17935 [Janibacter limosus]|uniref:Uncharacterized protein n=1 Tax=Janibacter limosus TaxID=53458 RepID=A0AC61U3F6_9MICO|nr:hypothetical protein [Janibacter limosus]UUZ44322.1 hypothetical protein LP422_17935 [Janibacter limosus]
MADKEVYLGVSIPDARRALRLVGGLMPSLSDHEVASLHKPVRETGEILALPGLEGVPVTPRELEWLLHRSCALGLPAPINLGSPDDGEWAEEDLHEFTDQIRWTATPFGRTLRVHGELDGEVIERHVCLMAVGRMTDLDIPPGVPWMQRTDELTFPVEWSGRIRIDDPAKVGQAMRRNIQKIRSQKQHYEIEHDEPAPGALDRQAAKALAVEDEISMGLSGLSCRCFVKTDPPVPGEL